MGDSEVHNNLSASAFDINLVQPLNFIRAELFKNTLHLQDLLKRSGINLNVSPNAYSNFSEPTQNGITKAQGILNNLKIRVEIVSHAIEQNISIDDTKGIFWLACRRFNLKPLSDFYNLLDDSGNVLEVYSVSDGYKQIFSNFKFWEMVSYPIDTILENEFYEIFQRDSSITNAIVDSATISFNNNKTISGSVPSHIVTESQSEKNYNFQIHIKHISPLRDIKDSFPVALVTILDAVQLPPNFRQPS